MLDTLDNRLCVSNDRHWLFNRYVYWLVGRRRHRLLCHGNRRLLGWLNHYRILDDYDPL